MSGFSPEQLRQIRQVVAAAIAFDRAAYESKLRWIIREEILRELASGEMAAELKQARAREIQDGIARARFEAQLGGQDLRETIGGLTADQMTAQLRPRGRRRYGG
ncbi:hypothetical protein [Caulobacter sp. 1776]|uniref:hypothetical protein n=1 Tax=Caulobacter sp. 1776 TaxID=3156420 RepID=UPI00339B7A01